MPLLVAVAGALALSGSAQAITVTASMDGAFLNVAWTQPEGYPSVFVDIVEVASAPDVDELGAFLFDNVIGFTTPDESISEWRTDDLELQQGRTYYVHAGYQELDGDAGWSPAVPFTVPFPSTESPSTPAVPSVPGTPVSPIVPIPGEAPSIVAPDYQTRVRRSGSMLLLGFRDRSQLDEVPPAPYKVCWTRPVGVGCTRRFFFDGDWDIVRLRVTRSVGRPQGSKREVRITWRIGGHVVHSATLSVRPARRR